MRTVLHILTRPDDTLARTIIEAQQSSGQVWVEVADLNAPQPDYPALVERIFAADSVEVW